MTSGQKKELGMNLGTREMIARDGRSWIYRMEERLKSHVAEYRLIETGSFEL